MRERTASSDSAIRAPGRQVGDDAEVIARPRVPDLAGKRSVASSDPEGGVGFVVAEHHVVDPMTRVIRWKGCAILAAGASRLVPGIAEADAHPIERLASREKSNARGIRRSV